MGEMADKMVAKAIENGTIDKRDSEIYRYGYQAMLDVAMNILGALLVAIVFNDIFSILFFLILLSRKEHLRADIMQIQAEVAFYFRL